MAAEKTVSQIIEEVKENMCNKYCKYPDQYTADEWEEVFMEVCENCPLDRL